MLSPECRIVAAVIAQLRFAAEDKAVRHGAELCRGHGYQRTRMQCPHSPVLIFPYAGCLTIAAALPLHYVHHAYISRQGERMDSGTASGLHSEGQPTFRIDAPRLYSRAGGGLCPLDPCNDLSETACMKYVARGVINKV